MTASETLNDVFLDDPRGGFPFRNSAWIAVAFERNAYDNSRMPEWFFRAASEFFGKGGAIGLMISGDCFVKLGFQEVNIQYFDWECYHEFMLRPEMYSVEYRMASTDQKCGCWADADITIFGGEPDQMCALLAALGGANHLLAHMRQEFFLGDTASYSDMDLFLQGLLFPSRRGHAGAKGREDN